MAAEKKLDELEEAWDYRGRPWARGSSSGGWSAAAMILVVELNERLTTLGIAVNLVTYLTGTMHLGSAAAANAVTNFLGTSFLLCLLGGFVADTYLGRYLTIAISTAIQAAGVSILTVSTAAPGLRPQAAGEAPSGTQLGVLYLGLYLTALGTGGLKSSVSGFGSDQFGADEAEEERSFFSWFFFLISIGSLLAVTVMVYVQDRVGRRWGYGACVAAILAGLVVFLAGTPRYCFKKLVGSPLTQIAAVASAAWRNREGEGKQMTNKPSEHDHVVQVARMLPVWATTIMFWTVYAQMTTFSVAQAGLMDRRLPHLGFQIPAGSLTVFFVASILITVPVYDRLLLPLARRCFPAGVSPLRRIFVGLLLAILAMVAAALTEHRRRRLVLLSDKSQPSSVFWLVPQFLLVGAGEAFTYVGQLDFFLRECPESMKTMSTGLFLTTLSLGFFLSTALVALVHALAPSWLADDLNHGSLDYFYWLLAAISAVNLIAFVAAAKGYVYKDKRLQLQADHHDQILVHA